MPVDVFRTIVGMKAEHDEGKLSQQLLKHGDQVSLGYLLNRTNNLKLGDFIHRINVVQPCNAVQIALVNRIYPNITGLAIGLRFASFANSGYLAAGLVKGTARALIDSGVSQVIEVRDRDAG